MTSGDIQEYSRVLCTAALCGADLDCSPTQLVTEILSSDELKKLQSATSPVAEAERKAMELAFSDKPEELCSILENGSIVSFERGYFVGDEHSLGKALAETSRQLRNSSGGNSQFGLITRHFGGVYFSFEQSVHLDAILSKVNGFSNEARDYLLAALLSTVSDAVNTVGKQFAQPLQPRNRDGSIKSNLANRASKDRSVDVITVFGKKLEKLGGIQRGDHDHRILKSDYLAALESHCADATVIYADPPYTRDHYSRFYHALETICLGDDPEISTTKIGGRLRLSRGLYRSDRHQSPFCIRSQAPSAFEALFAMVSAHNKPLVLSYSPFDGDSVTHPRVMTIDALEELGQKYFSNTTVCSPGALSHSKLNKSEKHLDSSDFGEVLLVFN